MSSVILLTCMFRIIKVLPVNENESEHIYVILNFPLGEAKLIGKKTKKLASAYDFCIQHLH